MFAFNFPRHIGVGAGESFGVILIPLHFYLSDLQRESHFAVAETALKDTIFGYFNLVSVPDSDAQEWMGVFTLA